MAAIFEQSYSHRMLVLVWNACSKQRSQEEKVWLSDSTIKSFSGTWASIIQCGGTTLAKQTLQWKHHQYSSPSHSTKSHKYQSFFLDEGRAEVSRAANEAAREGFAHVCLKQPVHTNPGSQLAGEKAECQHLTIKID